MSKKVDALVIIARLQLLPCSTVAETHRLSTMRAQKLGFLLTPEKESVA